MGAKCCKTDKTQEERIRRQQFLEHSEQSTLLLDRYATLARSPSGAAVPSTLNRPVSQISSHHQSPYASLNRPTTTATSSSPTRAATQSAAVAAALYYSAAASPSSPPQQIRRTQSAAYITGTSPTRGGASQQAQQPGHRSATPGSSGSQTFDFRSSSTHLPRYPLKIREVSQERKQQLLEQQQQQLLLSSSDVLFRSASANRDVEHPDLAVLLGTDKHFVDEYEYSAGAEDEEQEHEYDEDLLFQQEFERYVAEGGESVGDWSSGGSPSAPPRRGRPRQRKSVQSSTSGFFGSSSIHDDLAGILGGPFTSSQHEVAGGGSGSGTGTAADLLRGIVGLGSSAGDIFDEHEFFEDQELLARREEAYLERGEQHQQVFATASAEQVVPVTPPPRTKRKRLGSNASRSSVASSNVFAAEQQQRTSGGKEQDCRESDPQPQQPVPVARKKKKKAQQETLVEEERPPTMTSGDDVIGGGGSGGVGAGDVPPGMMMGGDRAPVFVREMSDVAVKVGTRARLLVEVDPNFMSSDEAIHITWYHNSEKVCIPAPPPPSPTDPALPAPAGAGATRIRQTSEGRFHYLDISPVMTEDEGKWVCSAQNASGINCCASQVKVMVPKSYRPPEFVEGLKAVLTEAGTVSLECKVIGTPTPLLKWYKDGTEIKAGDIFALRGDPSSLGVYTCEATNCMGTITSSSRVHMSTTPRSSPLPPHSLHITQPLSDTRVRVGERLDLQLILSKPIAPEDRLSVTWYNKSSPVPQSDRVIQHVDSNACVINLNPVEIHDDGEWVCEVTNTRDNVKVAVSSCVISLLVPRNYRRPKFLEDLKAILTEEGLVSFECKVCGFPTPILHWYKDGYELKPGDVYQLSGANSLGRYSCIAHNCMGSAESSTELTLEDIQHQLSDDERKQLIAEGLGSKRPPKFITGLRSLEMRIGESCTLAVEVSDPKATIQWYRDGTMIEFGGESNKYAMKTERGNHTLVIRELEFDDQAEWKCNASNEYGHSVSCAGLKLVIPGGYKKPKFLESLRAVLSEEGTVNLECKVIGVPVPVLKWFKDNVELKAGDIHRIISGADGTCCLGTYTCVAKNCMGEVSSSAALLGFEDKLEKDANAQKQLQDQQQQNSNNKLQRDPSLSTIMEERTSQMLSVYESPANIPKSIIDEEDLFGLGKGDVSVSIDGKDVSVSLYETPDLTENDARQIIEMFANEYSEYISEHNVVPLPSLRFVKETSTSGKIVMEAVVIDVTDVTDFDTAKSASLGGVLREDPTENDYNDDEFSDSFESPMEVSGMSDLPEGQAAGRPISTSRPSSLREKRKHSESSLSRRSSEKKRSKGGAASSANAAAAGATSPGPVTSDAEEPGNTNQGFRDAREEPTTSLYLSAESEGNRSSDGGGDDENVRRASVKSDIAAMSERLEALEEFERMMSEKIMLGELSFNEGINVDEQMQFSNVETLKYDNQMQQQQQQQQQQQMQQAYTNLGSESGLPIAPSTQDAMIFETYQSIGTGADRETMIIDVLPVLGEDELNKATNQFSAAPYSNVGELTDDEIESLKNAEEARVFGGEKFVGIEMAEMVLEGADTFSDVDSIPDRTVAVEGEVSERNVVAAVAEEHGKVMEERVVAAAKREQEAQEAPQDQAPPVPAKRKKHSMEKGVLEGEQAQQQGTKGVGVNKQIALVTGEEEKEDSKPTPTTSSDNKPDAERETDITEDEVWEEEEVKEPESVKAKSQEAQQQQVTEKEEEVAGVKKPKKDEEEEAAKKRKADEEDRKANEKAAAAEEENKRAEKEKKEAEEAQAKSAEEKKLKEKEANEEKAKKAEAEKQKEKEEQAKQQKGREEEELKKKKAAAEQEAKEKKEKEEKEKAEKEKKDKEEAKEKEANEKKKAAAEKEAKEKAELEAEKKRKQEEEKAKQAKEKAEKEKAAAAEEEKERKDQEAKAQADKEKEAQEKAKKDKEKEAMEKKKKAEEEEEKAEKERNEKAEKDAKEKERAQKEKQDKEAKEKLDKEKKEKEAKEKADKEKAEKEAKEKKEKEAREKADKEAKEKAEKEKQAAAEREKSEKEAKEQAEKDKAEKEKAAKEVEAKNKAEKEKKEKEAKEKADKEAKEKAEKEKSEKERAEKEAKEKAEKQKKEKEQADKDAKEKEEREKKEKEAKEKKEKEAREKADKEKAEKEAKEKADKEKKEQEAKEKAEKEKKEAEEAKEKDKKEQEAKEKAEKEAKEKSEREAKEKAEKERKEQETKEKAEKEKAEKDKADKEAKEKKEQEDKEKSEKEKKEKADKEAKELAENQKKEKEAKEKEKADKEAKELAEKEKEAKEKAEKEKKDKEAAAEEEKSEKEAKEKAEKEKKDKEAKVKAEKEKEAQEKADKEKEAQEKADKEKKEKEKADKDAKDKADREKAERDKKEEEKAELEKAEKEKKETEAKEKSEKEAKEKAEKEKKDKEAKEKADKEKEAKERKEKEAREKADKEAKEKAELAKKKEAEAKEKEKAEKDKKQAEEADKQKQEQQAAKEGKAEEESSKKPADSRRGSENKKSEAGSNSSGSGSEPSSKRPSLDDPVKIKAKKVNKIELQSLKMEGMGDDQQQQPQSGSTTPASPAETKGKSPPLPGPKEPETPTTPKKGSKKESKESTPSTQQKVEEQQVTVEKKPAPGTPPADQNKNDDREAPDAASKRKQSTGDNNKTPLQPEVPAAAAPEEPAEATTKKSSSVKRGSSKTRAAGSKKGEEAPHQQDEKLEDTDAKSTATPKKASLKSEKSESEPEVVEAKKTKVPEEEPAPAKKQAAGEKEREATPTQQPESTGSRKKPTSRATTEEQELPATAQTQDLKPVGVKEREAVPGTTAAETDRSAPPPSSRKYDTSTSAQPESVPTTRKQPDTSRHSRYDDSGSVGSSGSSATSRSTDPHVSSHSDYKSPRHDDTGGGYASGTRASQVQDTYKPRAIPSILDIDSKRTVSSSLPHPPPPTSSNLISPPVHHERRSRSPGYRDYDTPTTGATHRRHHTPSLDISPRPPPTRYESPIRVHDTSFNKYSKRSHEMLPRLTERAKSYDHLPGYYYGQDTFSGENRGVVTCGGGPGASFLTTGSSGFHNTASPGFSYGLSSAHNIITRTRDAHSQDRSSTFSTSGTSPTRTATHHRSLEDITMEHAHQFSRELRQQQVRAMQRKWRVDDTHHQQDSLAEMDELPSHEAVSPVPPSAPPRTKRMGNIARRSNYQVKISSEAEDVVCDKERVGGAGGGTGMFSMPSYFTIPSVGYSYFSMSSLPGSPSGSFLALDEAHRLKRPRFSMKLQNRTTPENTEVVKFACTVFGQPDPTIQWYKNGLPIFSDRQKYLITTSCGVATLDIRNVDRNDTGEYTCFARNFYGKAASSAILQVVGLNDQSSACSPPTKSVVLTGDDGLVKVATVPADKCVPACFTTPIIETTFVEVNELVLECQVKGHPRPEVMWMKNGQEIISYGQTNYGRFRADFASIFETGKCRLIIQRPRESDSGVYTCVARNYDHSAVGRRLCWTDEITKCVNVKAATGNTSPKGGLYGLGLPLPSNNFEYQAPRLITELEPFKRARIGQDLALTVEITGVPQPDVRWFHHKNTIYPIKPSAHTRVISEAPGVHTLYIPEVDAFDFGTYTVRVTNKYGMVESSCSISEVIPGINDSPTLSGIRTGRKPADLQQSMPCFVREPRENLLLRYGEDLVVECEVEGWPQVAVNLYRGCRNVTLQPRAYKEMNPPVPPSSSDTRQQVKFTITNLHCTDFGMYTIEAKNIVGVAKTFVNVRPLDTHGSTPHLLVPTIRSTRSMTPGLLLSSQHHVHHMRASTLQPGGISPASSNSLNNDSPLCSSKNLLLLQPQGSPTSSTPYLLPHHHHHHHHPYHQPRSLVTGSSMDLPRPSSLSSSALLLHNHHNTPPLRSISSRSLLHHHHHGLHYRPSSSTLHLKKLSCSSHVLAAREY